jgi:hypothetical protein
MLSAGQLEGAMGDAVPASQRKEIEIEAVLGALARRHRAANSTGMRLVSIVGGSAENMLERLPDRVKDGLEAATRSALVTAFDVAKVSRGVVADRGDWLNMVVTAALGVAGGAGGLPTALAELPVTATVLLRAIQGIAAEHGFDPADEAVRTECLKVFASAGPLEKDDGAELGFFAARVTITGNSVQSVIAAIVPRLSAVFGQKLAVQAAPVIGALTGAAINAVFTAYYQDMARVHFGLLRLSRETGRPRHELTDRLRALLT